MSVDNFKQSELGRNCISVSVSQSYCPVSALPVKNKNMLMSKADKHIF